MGFYRSSSFKSLSFRFISTVFATLLLGSDIVESESADYMEDVASDLAQRYEKIGAPKPKASKPDKPNVFNLRVSQKPQKVLMAKKESSRETFLRVITLRGFSRQNKTGKAKENIFWRFLKVFLKSVKIFFLC